MTNTIYRGSIQYSAVLNEGHNQQYMDLIEETIKAQNTNLKLSWKHNYDEEEYEPEEIEENIADDPYYMKTLTAEGETAEFVIFYDDLYSINLENASEEWITLVNSILRALENYNTQTFGGNVETLDDMNS